MKYNTIVIDPPWKLKMNLVKEFQVRYPDTLPYDMMTDKELLDFKLVPDLASDRCDLFVWITHGKLPFGFKLIEKWGFKYRNLLTWHKKRQGISVHGIYRNTEFVIHASNFKTNLNYKKPIPTLISAKGRGHSVKPYEFYEVLRKSSLEPRIDIFARQRHIGFDAYGNEIQNQKIYLEEFLN